MAALVLLGELLLWMSGFNYIPPDAGFRITPEYGIFRIEGENYKTKKEKLDSFRDQSFPVKKNKNEVRIFIFGGSSIYNLDKADVLENKLRDISAGKVIRIINFGGNSYGTSRLLLSFQEALSYEPDIMLLYSGHNEFEEQFIEKIVERNSPLKRINDILLEQSRIYQLLSFGIQKTETVFVRKVVNLKVAGKIPFFPSATRVSWGIDYDEAAKKYVYQRYRKNILKMISLAGKNHIKMAISTVAYNRVFSPFKDQTMNSKKGLELYGKGKYNEALVFLEAGLDGDLQPHRASRITNAIVRNISERTKTPLVDVDKAICLAAEHGIPGQDLFTDHCHLNEKGNIILQELFYLAIKNNRMLE
jgi:hypothetical protein